MSRHCRDTHSVVWTRVRLRIAASGTTVCLPGAQTKNNDWTLDGSQWTVQQILNSGALLALRDGRLQTDTVFYVSAVNAPEGKPAPEPFPLDACVKHAEWVEVMCGRFGEKIPFTGLACTEVPRTEVDHIGTSPTRHLMRGLSDTAPERFWKNRRVSSHHHLGYKTHMLQRTNGCATKHK